jgi:predicted kinase
MLTVYFLKGLPGSGKSTWAKDFVKRNTNFIRINKDDIRAMLGYTVWSHEHEDLVISIRDNSIRNALKANFSVIVDDTNFAPNHFKRVMQICEQHGDINLITKYFDVDLEETKKRNANRPNSVPENVILDMYSKYVKGKSNLQKDSIYFEPKDNVNAQIYEDNPSLKKAIIVDMDGTLAIHNGRGPFEYEKCDTDLENKKVSDVLRTYKKLYGNEVTVVVMSGRDDSCQEKTKEWLQLHKIPFDEIHMRTTGDFRKDAIIKEELYNEFVKGKYNILFVLDDRTQVIKTWRDLGLCTFQVAEGNF